MTAKFFSSAVLLAMMTVATWSSCQRGDGTKKDSSGEKTASDADDVTDDSGEVTCDALCLSGVTLVNLGNLPLDAVLSVDRDPEGVDGGPFKCQEACPKSFTGDCNAVELIDCKQPELSIDYNSNDVSFVKVESDSLPGDIIFELSKFTATPSSICGRHCNHFEINFETAPRAYRCAVTNVEADRCIDVKDACDGAIVDGVLSTQCLDGGCESTGDYIWRCK